MVASHIYDLRAAAGCGVRSHLFVRKKCACAALSAHPSPEQLKTIYIPRSTEDNPPIAREGEKEGIRGRQEGGEVDVVIAGLEELIRVI